MNDEHKIFAHVQAVAMQFNAWKGTFDDLIRYVLISMKAGDKGRVERLLRKEEVQKELASHWEVGLWRGSDHQWRLVSLAVNPNPSAATKRLNAYPPNTNSCRWCRLDERHLADTELRPELDVRRQAVPASRLHPMCMRPWAQLRALAEQKRPA